LHGTDAVFHHREARRVTPPRIGCGRGAILHASDLAARPDDAMHRDA
jgi:hypothetical protein